MNAQELWQSLQEYMEWFLRGDAAIPSLSRTEARLLSYAYRRTAGRCHYYVHLTIRNMLHVTGTRNARGLREALNRLCQLELMYAHAMPDCDEETYVISVPMAREPESHELEAARDAAVRERNRGPRGARLRKNGGSHSEAEWEDLKAHFDWRCVYCGEQPDELCEDHIVPVVMGGSDNIDNIQPLCRSCNSRKGSKTIDYRRNPGGAVP